MVRKLNEGNVGNVSSREDMISKIIETYLYETEDDMYNNNINQEGYEAIAEAFKVCLCVDLETLDDLGDWDITEGFFQPITTEGIKKVYQYLVKNYPNGTKSVTKQSVKEDVQSDWLDNITFVMYEYVQSKMYGVKIVEDTKDGNFRVSYEGEVVDISFDTTEDGYYVYTINDEGPYAHHSYEFIRGDIMQYVDTLYGVENDEEE